MRRTQAEDITDFILSQKKTPRLSHEEELQLARIVQTAVIENHPNSSYFMPDKPIGYELFVPSLDGADPRAVWAYQKMIRSNQGLVAKLAKKYRYLMSFEDLFQEGSIGLARAVTKFKPSRGCRFSTYAYQWIKQAIQRAIGDKSRSIRLPAHVFEKVLAVSRAYRELKGDATVTTVAKKLGWTVEDVKAINAISRPTLSTDTIYRDSEGGESSLLEWIGADGNLFNDWAKNEDIARLIEAIFNLNLLTDGEKKVLFYRYGFDGNGKKSFQDVANMNGTSKQNAQLKEKHAKNKIANYLRDNCIDLRDYLEESA